MSPILAVGVPLLVLGVVLLVAPIWQRMRSAEAWGKIVAITATHQCVNAAAVPPVSTSIDVPVVEFETELGQRVTARLTHGAVTTCMVGESIHLRYNRRMPDRVVVPTAFDWIIPSGLVALGVLCIVAHLVAIAN
jgi:hypothetical protein